MEIRDDEADAMEQLADLVLDFRHDPARLRRTIVGAVYISEP